MRKEKQTGKTHKTTRGTISKQLLIFAINQSIPDLQRRRFNIKPAPDPDTTFPKGDRKPSAVIVSLADTSSGVLSFRIPNSYAGKNITLKAMLRTENVSEGGAARNGKECFLALSALVDSIQDTHAALNSPSLFQHYGIGSRLVPFRCLWTNGQAVVAEAYTDSSRSESDLLPGDIILAVNGAAIEERIERISGFSSFSNDAVKMNRTLFHALRSDDATMDLQILRKSDTLRISRKTCSAAVLNEYDRMHKERLRELRFAGEGIAYIGVGGIKPRDILKRKREILSSRGLVIDLREYPAHVLTFFMLNGLLASEKTPTVKWTFGSEVQPGLFCYRGTTKYGWKNRNPFKGRVAILVNSRTQSHGEFSAMAYRACARENAVIGSTTAGADGNVSRIDLPGGLYTYFSGLGVLYPDGTETQRVGIVPDIFIEPTPEGLAAGRDEMLERAVRYIETGR